MAREGIEHQPVVLDERLQLVRAGPDGLAIVRRGPRGHDAHDEIDWKRSERLLEREHDGVVVGRVHGGEIPVCTRTAAEVRVQKAPERVDDVGGRQLVAVVKQHAAAQMRHIRERIGLLERFRELGNDPQIAVDADEAVVEELMRLLRDLVGTDARIEVERCIGHGYHDRVPFRARLAAAGRGCEDHDRRPHGDGLSPQHHPPASRFSSSRIESACMGVKLFTSMSRSRWCSGSCSGAGA